MLLITSNPTTQDDDVIPRRPGGELTDDDIRKLEDQGVPRDSHHDDLSIMKARYGLDKDKTIAEVLRDDGSLTCEQVTTKIAQLLKNTATSGGEVIISYQGPLDNTILFAVVLRYVGPGKKGTGDWCFSDGFISFRDIMQLYLQNAYFKGRVLSITTDCSYSGCWVKEAMVFMDEQDVGPCGHAAKEKGILVKVYASCQANEIPAELAFSTHCAKNDKNIGTVFYLSDEDIHDGQHTRRLDFTVIRCKSKIDEPCTMAPGSTWHQWSTAQRTWKVRGRGKDRGQPAWLYILLADDEDTIREFHEKEGSLDVFNYGQVLKSGFGQDPPEETHKWLKENYLINYDYQS